MSNERTTPGTGPGTGRAAATFTSPAHAMPPLGQAAAVSSNAATAPAPHKHDSRLIQKPGAQPALPRTLWGMVTGLFWLIYLYLWTPVLTLVLWLLGIRNVASELYLRTHEVDPFLMLALPATAGVVVALLLIWAEYNRWRFASASSERRGTQHSVALEEVGRALGASSEVAAALNAGRVSVLHMDPNHAVPVSVSAVVPTFPAQPFPPVAMPKFARPAEAPNNSWLLALALSAIALVIAVLIVISHGYRQIESSAPMQAIEGTPGIDRPGLEAAPELIEQTTARLSQIDRVADATIAATAKANAAAAAAEKARLARARVANERRARAADAASAKPRPLPGFSPKPPYPLEALRHSEGGLVTLRVQVSADGHPLKVEVSRRSGNRILDRAAINTVRRWRFAPAVRNGKPIAAVVIVPIEFTPRN
ncbi:MULTISPECIES: poly-beta-1,6-N-acetyl-D-glucosamine biosynthesis protein PgaD [unclassified Lysobacter]|uniref:poly-beta-1,6-N-acetyl-D-glucosamine biosynthesis protein PgaD n=1 Tax=unclassified Lysobacter TaxID=2635362 RepID=UPI001BE9C699|nr:MULTISPECIES: poly-beta-1,6-N-acetyl-D-glucosamine biosynthesis protein PgaD [unclassified Lysobacter]MBT2747596.1 poly-beta-1,6-N-acetyl-D-glucosamine biosynthesis protein PgaD [Lysobacter sp. ISL-42]MBT2752419.1 poly-beta-1,6-N-acetyl-D-glucosamine biosynthesis protein PgaD [Lysobacter sp. ISL-50]MBT2776162.1 poly-beta-1,6-N-acetyl-D-glucosamine biosynthesis protein PgaD [Lysobacter sp. ISL-54]MBT2784246.1 poly-beta-1,6-N-acetyl-D-glucosamine biosynthesis protein PgaD [Lysobacter sp. ISL-5